MGILVAMRTLFLIAIATNLSRATRRVVQEDAENDDNTGRRRTGKTGKGRTGKTAKGRTGKTAKGRTGKTAKGRTGKTAKGRTGKTSKGRAGKTAKDRTGKQHLIHQYFRKCQTILAKAVIHLGFGVGGTGVVDACKKGVDFLEGKKGRSGIGFVIPDISMAPPKEVQSISTLLPLCTKLFSKDRCEEAGAIILDEARKAVGSQEDKKGSVNDTTDLMQTCKTSAMQLSQTLIDAESICKTTLLALNIVDKKQGRSGSGNLAWLTKKVPGLTKHGLEEGLAAMKELEPEDKEGAGALMTVCLKVAKQDQCNQAATVFLAQVAQFGGVKFPMKFG